MAVHSPTVLILPVSLLRSVCELEGNDYKAIAYLTAPLVVDGHESPMLADAAIPTSLSSDKGSSGGQKVATATGLDEMQRLALLASAKMGTVVVTIGVPSCWM